MNQNDRNFKEASEAIRLSEEVSREPVTVDELPSSGHPTLTQYEKPKTGGIKNDQVNERMSHIFLVLPMQEERFS